MINRLIDSQIKKNKSNVTYRKNKGELTTKKIKPFDSVFKHSLTRKIKESPNLIHKTTKEKLKEENKFKPKEESKSKIKTVVDKDPKQFCFRYNKFFHKKNSDVKKKRTPKFKVNDFKGNYAKKNTKKQRPFKFVNSKLKKDFSFTKQLKKDSFNYASSRKAPTVKSTKRNANLSLNSYANITKSEITMILESKKYSLLYKKKAERVNKITLSNVLDCLKEDKSLKTGRDKIKVN